MAQLLIFLTAVLKSNPYEDYKNIYVGYSRHSRGFLQSFGY